ncbi:MAG: hypothetical protein ACRDUX_17705 [Mycobacterium sp.]
MKHLQISRGAAIVVSVAWASIATAQTPPPVSFVNPLKAYFCKGYAKTHEFCTGVATTDDTVKVLSKHGDIEVRIRTEPNLPVVWVKLVEHQGSSLRVRMHKKTNNVMDKNPFFSEFITIDRNRCAGDSCILVSTPTSAQYQAIQTWLWEAPVGEERSITVAAVITNFLAYPGAALTDTSYAHTSFTVLVNPQVGGGCTIAPADGSSATVLLVPLAMLLLTRLRRRAALAGCAIALLTLGPRTGLAQVLIVDRPGGTDDVWAAFYNGTLTTENMVAGTSNAQSGGQLIYEDGLVTTGTPDGDGCYFPSVLFAAETSSGFGWPHSLSFYTDPQCNLYVSFKTPGNIGVGDEGSSNTVVTHEADLLASPSSSFCQRYTQIRMSHYNQSLTLWPFGYIGIEEPSWWPDSFKSPKTRIDMTARDTDWGDSLTTGSGDHKTTVDALFGWQAVTHGSPSNIPPSFTRGNRQENQDFGEKLQWFSRTGSSVLNQFFEAPQGDTHFLHIGYDMQPAGKIDLVAEWGGTLPNQVFSVVPPRIPYSYNVVYNAVYGYGGYCPPDFDPPLVVFYCGQKCLRAYN